MPNSSSSSSSSSSSNSSTAKAKKAAKNAAKAKAKALSTGVRNNVTARYGKGRLAAETRKLVEKKLKRIREDEDLESSERRNKEAALFAKVNGLLAEQNADKAAKKAAKEAEQAAKREAAKSARSALTTARREQRDRNLAKAKANLKNYLGESPIKKHINALYKARKNRAGMTAKNYAKAAGLHRTRKLTESQRKLQKVQKKVGAEFVEKGVDAEEFCERASAYTSAKEWLEKKHKDAGFKHSLSTIVDVCGKEIVVTPPSS